jgi:hypothetical protein
MKNKIADSPPKRYSVMRYAHSFIIHTYDNALVHNPKAGEACWGLATLHTEMGRADPALRACRQGLGLSLSERQRSALTALQEMLQRLRRPANPVARLW